MRELKHLQEAVIKFRNDRDWEKFHNPKDMSISLILEAAELLEHFQWKNEKEVKSHIKNNKESISDELADVLIYLLMIAYDLNIDLNVAVDKKLVKNESKYPIEKVKGKHLKYNQY